MIRKTLLAAGTLLASGVASAQGIYANAQLAIADVDGFDKGTALVGTIGFPMAQKNLSIEAELTKTLTSAEESTFVGDAEVDYFTLAGYAVYALPLQGSNASLRFRAGLLYEDVEVDTPVGDASDTDIGLSFGAGVTFALSKTMNFIGEFTIIESDINHLSAGVQFKL